MQCSSISTQYYFQNLEDKTSLHCKVRLICFLNYWESWERHWLAGNNRKTFLSEQNM